MDSVILSHCVNLDEYLSYLNVYNFAVIALRNWTKNSYVTYQMSFTRMFEI